MAKGSTLGKDPAVLWYWNDWLGGTCTFSRHLKGCYMDLMCAQFNTGALSLEEVKVVLGSDFGSAWPTLQKKFKVDESGKYYNSRLMEELIKRKNFSASRANSLNINNNDMVHIYLLVDKATGFHKIGSSKYPLIRLSEVKKNFSKAELFWQSESLVIRTEEKNLHEEFSDKRKYYDWFDLTEEDIKDITNRQLFKYRTGDENENDIENRKLLFKKECENFIEGFGVEMIEDFYSYWTEPNKNKTKFRMEMEKTWDLERRLNTWNKNNFGKRSDKKESKITTTINSTNQALEILRKQNEANRQQ